MKVKGKGEKGTAWGSCQQNPIPTSRVVIICIFSSQYKFTSRNAFLPPRPIFIFTVEMKFTIIVLHRHIFRVDYFAFL